MDREDKRAHLPPLEQRALYRSVIFVAVVALAALIWVTAHYLLLFFAGILLAVLLDAIASGLRRVLPVPRPIRLLLSVLIVAAAFAGLALVIPSVAEQGPQFASLVEDWFRWLSETVSQWEIVREAMAEGESGQLLSLMPDPVGLLGGAAQIVTGAVAFLTGAILIAVFGIYLASEPKRYFEDGLKIFSPERQAAVAKTAEEMGYVLRRWLVAQITMMLIIGLSSYVVLTLLGVPLALLLSFIAGLTAFIPYIGPLMGGSIMILVAATQELRLGFIVLGFYIVLQLVESYLLTPLIQSRAIYVPPAIVILAQLLFGVMFGLLGIALATPLAAVIAVVISRIYFHEPINGK